jgi:tricorn protease
MILPALPALSSDLYKIPPMVHALSVLAVAFTTIACASSPRGEQPQRVAERAVVASSAGPTRMLRGPALSAERVAFDYAGDLWSVRHDGGDLRRLTSHPGQEARPRFSPDGSEIAFSAEYDGNFDVYVVSATGGEPRRLTWHPGADFVQDWNPDGSAVLFTSTRDVHTNRFRRLFSVSAAGGHPSPLPVPTAFRASYSPDGTRIAYVPLRAPFTQWKNYRGGTTSRIWILTLSDLSVEQVPQPEGRCNDTDPMWVGEDLHFLSDRDGEFNLYTWGPGAEPQRLTEYEDFPILSASAGAGQVVYEQAGYLHTYKPGQGSRQLPIEVQADLVETRPRWVSGGDHVRSGDISPSGERAVFGLRGEIVTVPAKDGDPRNITNTPGIHERHPVWSPDGRWIAYISDASGENQMHIAPQAGRGSVRVFELGGAGFYENLAWSPDSNHLSYWDNSLGFFVLEIESGEVTEVGRELAYSPVRTMHHDWSPDSRWLAYTLNTAMNFRQVHLFDMEAGVAHAITDGLSDVSEPVFDASGKYLWFAASTNAGPSKTWFAMSNADADVSNALYLAVLDGSADSPFSRKSDEVQVEEDDAEDEDEEANEDSQTDEASEDEAPEEDAIAVVHIEGLSQRIVALPLGVGDYENLRAGKDGELYYIRSQPGFGFEGGSHSLARFDLESREETVLLEGASGFTVSAKASHLLVSSEGGFNIAAAGSPVKLSEGKLDLDRARIKIDPRAEWAQIFDEAWRINRDFFYDPNMHGADWPAMREKYAQFLPHLAVRGDLNRLIRWMCSELAVGHHSVGGGETLVEVESIPGGLLGADYEIADGRYRFARVFGGLNWNPELRAPLSQPGVNVVAGEYLLAVNGRDLTPPENLYSRFENTAGRIVELTVGPNADGTDSRTVEVVPTSSESSLRNRAWVEGNIAKVTEATDGRVAYTYVPNTAGLGHLYFKRYFFPQADRDAIIIDERYNGGGQVADYYIDLLRRPIVSWWAMRYGADLRTPQAAIPGPKVMIIDETAGSGGDLLPWMFRQQKIGQLVGRRTWGGLVGILGFPTLMDGGRVTAPNLGIWTEDGFVVENVGVPPDIEVEQWPADVAAGRDPQLEKAIEVVLQQLEANPVVRPVRPPFPIRARR